MVTSFGIWRTPTGFLSGARLGCACALFGAVCCSHHLLCFPDLKSQNSISGVTCGVGMSQVHRPSTRVLQRALNIDTSSAFTMAIGMPHALSEWV